MLAPPAGTSVVCIFFIGLLNDASGKTRSKISPITWKEETLDTPAFPINRRILSPTFVFNGRTGALVGEGQLNAKVGDKIRLFIGNTGVSKVSSFHVIGEIFDRVFPEASLSSPIKNVQTTLVPAGGASIVEFKVDYPGNYVLVDHALTRVDRGAWGILNVTGPKNDSLYMGETEKNMDHKKEKHSGH